MSDLPDATPELPPETDPILSLARAGDWRSLLAIGRFGLAEQTYRLTGGDDLDLRSALAGLAEVEGSVRSKSLARAQRRLGEVQRTPADLLDWAGLEADLATLVEATKAVDQREAESARASLGALRTELFLAEREALLGTIAVYEQDLDAARAHLAAALAVDPNHVRALTNRGNLKLEAGDVDGAIEDYQRAIKLDDSFANAHHNLGVAYRRKGQVGKSVSSLRRAQRLSGRRDAEEARATLAASGRGWTQRPWLRWLSLITLGAIIYWVLRNQGIL